MTATILATALVAANPGPVVHLAVLGIVVLVGLAVYAVIRWRRRSEAAAAERQPDAHDPPSANPPTEAPRS